MDHPKSDRPDERGLDADPVAARKVDLKAKLLAVLDQAEGYRVLAIRSRDRGERESYEHIVELYVKIAEELETMLDRSWSQPTPRPVLPGSLPQTRAP
jgi:hypothetical protein